MVEPLQVLVSVCGGVCVNQQAEVCVCVCIQLSVSGFNVTYSEIPSCSSKPINAVINSSTKNNKEEQKCTINNVCVCVPIS